MSEPGPITVLEHGDGNAISSAAVLLLLPRPVRRILDTCPAAGDGVHFWIYAAACALARAGVDPQMAARLIRDGSADCGRHVEAREIIEAIGMPPGSPAPPAGSPGQRAACWT